MKKIFTFFNFLLLILFISSVIVHPQIQLKRLWEKSDRLKNKASWFGAPASNSNRGFAYGVVGGNERLYIVNGSAIQIVNATDGSDVGTLDVTGISGGTLGLLDVEVSSDGVIFACNLTTSASTSAFKIYKWTTEGGTPTNVISYTGAAYRLGDKFSVVGSTADNSIVIYAAAAGTTGANHVIKFTTTDNAATFSATDITTDLSPGNGPGVTVVSTGSSNFYVNGNSYTPKEYQSDGTLVGTMPASAVSTTSNAIKYFSVGGQNYLVTYEYVSTSLSGGLAKILNVTSGIASATIYATTPDLGYIANANGAGDVAVKDNGDGTFNIYVLGTNNGFGAYTNASPISYSGTYTVGSGGNFSSLLLACDALNQGVISGSVTLSIISDLTEDRNVCLGVNAGGNTITIKPASSTTPTVAFTATTDVGGPSGALVIGSSSLTAYVLIPTNGVVIDGSNTVGGTTRDLSITVADNATTYGPRIIGNSDNVTIKNINLTLTEAGTASSYGVLFTARNQNSTNYIPDNGIVENCSITNTAGNSCQGIAVVNSGTLNANEAPTGMIFRHNTVTARTRGIFMFPAADYSVYGNTISVNQTTTGLLSYGIWALSTNGVTSHTCNIYNNKLIQLGSANSTAGSYGIVGIAVDVPGTFNIYNNSLSGFSYPTLTGNGIVAGIYITNAAVNCNVYYNSVNMDGLGIPSIFYGIAVTSLTYSGTVDIKDNIVAINDADATAYCTYRGIESSGTYTSNYNDFYPNGANVKFGYWGAAGAQSDLSTWQTTTSQDANSLSADPKFIAAGDLHLAGDSPCLETGVDVGIATDLDGNTRPTGSGYDIGAYEYQYPPAPTAPVASPASNVVYTSFTANWGTSSGATSYQLDVATDISFTSFIINNLNVGNVLSYNVTGLTDNTPYYYRVRGYNGLASGNSNTITVTTLVQPTFSGTYTIGTSPRPTEVTDYATLKEACDALNLGKIVGNVTMSIVSNLTEAANVALGVNTSGYSITFKPAVGTTPTINFTQTADNNGASGQWVIGAKSVSSWDSLVATNSIIIDGSNISGGTTRDLSITNVENDVNYNFGIRVVGNADNVTIKNINITITETGNTTSSSYAINFAARGSLVPDNGIVENCNVVITQPPLGQGIAISPSTTPGTGITSTGMIFRNNNIQAATRGIFVNIGSSFTINDNTISVTQPVSGFLSNGIFVVSTNSVTSHICNIYNNNINQLSTANIAAANGIAGITIDQPGTYNIFNNMICGYNQTAATTLGLMQGIRSNSASALQTLNIYFNTIVLPEDVDLTASDAGGIAGIALANASFAGNATIKNNIIVVNNNPSCFGIYRANTGGTFVSDYNNVYTPGTNGNFGAWNAIAQQTLALWQAASLQDANSKSVAVTFAGPTDLHLAAPSIGDLNLVGTPIAGISTDIDGNTRSSTFPYKGADESTAFVVPTLNLTALIEGFYNGATMVADTVTVELHNASNPWAMVDQAKVVLSTSGTASVNFLSATDATNYYIVIKHRNSIETWSKLTQQFTGGALTYDFTAAATQAYGDNLKLKSGKYCIFSGDVNGSGTINVTDINAVFTASNLGLTGYVVTDVNGSNTVNVTDINIAYANSNLGVSVQKPGLIASEKEVIPIGEIENKEIE